MRRVSWCAHTTRAHQCKRRVSAVTGSSNRKRRRDVNKELEQETIDSPRRIFYEWIKENSDSGTSIVAVLVATEQQDVRLRPVDGVMLPASALLNAEAAPLGFAQEAPLGHCLGDVRRQDHMPGALKPKDAMNGSKRGSDRTRKENHQDHKSICTMRERQQRKRQEYNAVNNSPMHTRYKTEKSASTGTTIRPSRKTEKEQEDNKPAKLLQPCRTIAAQGCANQTCHKLPRRAT